MPHFYYIKVESKKVYNTRVYYHDVRNASPRGDKYLVILISMRQVIKCCRMLRFHLSFWIDGLSKVFIVKVNECY